MSEADANGAELIETRLTRPTRVRWNIVALLCAFSFMNHFNRVSMVVAGDEVIMKQYHISTTAMGAVYSAFLLVYTLFMTPGGVFINRVGPKAALVTMGIGTGLFSISTGLVGAGWLAAGLIWPALLVVRGLTGMCAAPLHPASGQAVSNWFPPAGRAWAYGLALGAALVGIACVYKVFGSLIDLLGWPLAFVCSGTCTALLALFWWFYATDWPRQHRSTNAAERALTLGEEPAATKPLIETETPIEAGGGDVSPSAGRRSLLRNRSIVLLTVSYAAIGYFEYLFMY